MQLRPPPQPPSSLFSFKVASSCSHTLKTEHKKTLRLPPLAAKRCKDIQCIWGGGAAPSPPTPFQLVFLKVASSCSHTLSNQQQQQQQQKTLFLEGVSLQEEPGCIGSGVTRCLSVLVSLFLVFMLVSEGVWLKRCKNIQCIWGGGAAPSPQPPSSLFFF